MSQDKESCGKTGHLGTESGCDGDTPCEENFCETKRRKLLGAVAAGGSLSLAGCVGAFASPEGADIAGEHIVDEYQVEYLLQEETLTARGDQNLLEAGEEAGFEIPYFCRTGFCGVCLSKVDGDANELVNMRINQYEELDEELVEEGYMLPCTSQPREDLSLETGVQLPEEEDEEEEEDEDDDETDDETEQPGQTHVIRYTEEGWILEVGENENLLEAGEDRGLDLPSQCREGFCGQCLAQVDGDANELVEMTTNDYGPLDEDAMADGYTLTCTGQPRDDFDLESGKYGDLD